MAGELRKKAENYLRPFLNWKFLISFGIAWMITNGWCYLFIFFGTRFKITWMLTIGTAYAAFLYFPFTVEKVVTIPIAIWLQTRIFPRDAKLHVQLIKMQNEARNDARRVFRKTIARREMKRIGE